MGGSTGHQDLESHEGSESAHCFGCALSGRRCPSRGAGHSRPKLGKDVVTWPMGVLLQSNTGLFVSARSFVKEVRIDLFLVGPRWYKASCSDSKASARQPMDALWLASHMSRANKQTRAPISGSLVVMGSKSGGKRLVWWDIWCLWIEETQTEG